MASADNTGAFKYGVYKSLGFDVGEAIVLAQRVDIDWHKVKDAIKNGCTTEQALRIFT